MKISQAMRALMLSGSLVIAFSSMSAWARDEGPTSIDQPAPKVRVESITSGENAGTIIISLPNMRLEVPAPRLEDEETKVFAGMDEEYTKLFHSNRAQYLTWSAQLLSTAFMNNVIGSGSLVKDRIMWTWEHIRNGAHAMSRPAPMVYTQEMYDKNPERYQQEEDTKYIEPRVLKSFKEHKAQVVERYLLNIDRSFWKNPYLTANSNEFAIFISGGITSFAGVDIKKGRFKMNKGVGGSMELGMFLGFNRTTKSTVLQIYRLTEKFKATLTGVSANLAFVPKVGIMLANSKPGTEMNPEQGRVEYPPAPPGVSVYYTVSPKRVAFGANPPFGLIPWPLDSFLMYSMDYVMKPMLRINLRVNTLKDVVHVETGNMALPKRASKESVARVVDLIRAKASGKRLCVRMHTI